MTKARAKKPTAAKAKSKAKSKAVSNPSQKHPGGRPTKYKPEYCQALIDFYDVEPYTDVEINHYGKDGEIKWTDTKRMANKLPTLRNFAKSINCGISTVYDWLNEKHESYQPKFSDAFTQAKSLLKWFLIENGLNGCHNPIYAKFVAINMTNMRDKVDHGIEGDLVITVSRKKADA